MAIRSIAFTINRPEPVRVGAILERFGADHHLSADEIANVNLVLDEILANVIRHGYTDDGKHQIDVALALEGGELRIEVTDAGVPFNPLDAPPPDFDLPITERPAGGLGIHIVKSLVETMEYRRENGRNHLNVTMRVAG